jgi:hypothetical protein
MKNKIAVLFFTLLLVFVFVFPANAKVIYGPGTAPATSGPLYDQNGNTYYYNQPSNNSANNTANAIASILGMIISSAQQQNEQKKLQEQQKQHETEWQNFLSNTEDTCRSEANEISNALTRMGLSDTFTGASNYYRSYGWNVVLYHNDRCQFLYGRHTEIPNAEVVAVYDSVEKTITVARYIPASGNNGGYLITETANIYGDITP